MAQEGEFEGLAEFFDGEIISYDNPNDYIQGSSSTDGELVEQTIAGKIYNIQTTSGKTYRMYVESYSVYENNKDFLGITNLVFYCEDDYSQTEGYPEEAVYVIGGILS
ncbi:MAG: DUF5104 domain-containing protein [Faecalibacterium sp.]